MNLQPELLPQDRGFHPDLSLGGPLLWIRELRLLRTFSPGDANVVRRIPLRPGVNILWAHPMARGGGNNVGGVSGHASGKTTFCRFLRHLLGEPNFGSDEQRARLRHNFPEGWLVGEVRLAKEPWLVCRPFKVGAHPFVIQGEVIESLFETLSPKLPIKEYFDTLNRLLTESLPIATFATSPTPIEWPHLLQWLSRDQECRFAGIADLRHPNSDSESPEMNVEDRHALFRAVLRLIDPTEQTELEKNKALLVTRQRVEKQAPLFKFRGEAALLRLRSKLPNFGVDYGAEDFLEAIGREFAAQSEALGTMQREMPEPESLRIARETYFEAETEKRIHLQRRNEVAKRVQFIEEQIGRRHGQAAPSGGAISTECGCGQPIAAALEWKCPLAQGRDLSIAVPSDADSKSTVEFLGKTLQAEKAVLLAIEKELTGQESVLIKAREAVVEQTQLFDRQRGKLARQSAEFDSLVEQASQAADDTTAARELEESLTDLDQQIRRSQTFQTAIRERQSAALSTFSGIFSRVIQTILGTDIQGSIRFHGRQIRPTLVHGIDLTSAALETLKIICFDLAALISGMEGSSLHPRFLIHDGPREADMDVELYQRLFLLVAKLEESFQGNPPNFQYVVTTTEPPPASMQSAPWLIEPVLDASNAIGKLLGEDF
ncbi:MAG: hypothetical protein JWL59_4269 [Chthoniobacteraceae bacterium]|nr:hypothetical protein [Chthoniobacteraceae bacterium]